MSLTKSQRQELKRYFAVSADYFQLPEDVRRVAWQQTQRSEVRAYACYKAITLSLSPDELRKP